MEPLVEVEDEDDEEDEEEGAEKDDKEEEKEEEGKGRVNEAFADEGRGGGSMCIWGKPIAADTD